VALASSVLLSAQNPPAMPPPQDPQQAPTFRSRVDSIVVDVSVTDKQGKPVTDLTKDDFEIREANKPQTVDNFRLIQAEDPEDLTSLAERQITSLSDQRRETEDPANRLFIILLDDYHVRVGNSMRVREQLAQFVRQLGPRDLVAVLYPLTTVAATTFSRFHDGTAQAIMNFKGRKYDYQPMNAYEEQMSNAPPEIVEQFRNEMVIRTLASACVYLGSLREGRKTILMVSEGMTASLPLGVRTTGTPIYQPRGGTDPNSTQAFFKETELLSRMQDIFGAASRSNTSIFTLDPRGLATGEFSVADNVTAEADRQVMNVAMDSLRIIADQTDGRAIVNKNNPVPELNKMVRELSSYYLLSYTSTVAARDGKFHPIQVRVKRRDVEVHARKGYWAFTEDEARAMTSTPKAGPTAEVATALDDMVAVIEPSIRKPAAVSMAAAKGASERARVTYIWEGNVSPAQDPIDRVAQVAVTATAGSGEVVFQGTLKSDPATGRVAGMTSFDAPAGLIRVRTIAQNARGQRIDQDDITFEVADFTSARVQLSTPLMYRARTVREVATIKANPEAIPVVGRQFSRTERVLLRFDAYGPAGTTPKIALRLLNRVGASIADMPAPTPAAGNTLDSDLSLSALPPGDYLLEIIATAGEESVKKLIGIRITG